MRASRLGNKLEIVSTFDAPSRMARVLATEWVTPSRKSSQARRIRAGPPNPCSTHCERGHHIHLRT